MTWSCWTRGSTLWPLRSSVPDSDQRLDVQGSLAIDPNLEGTTLGIGTTDHCSSSETGRLRSMLRASVKESVNHDHGAAPDSASKKLSVLPGAHGVKCGRAASGLHEEVANSERPASS